MSDPAPAPVPGALPGRMFLRCNLVALGVAAVTALPVFYLPPSSSSASRELARYDLSDGSVRVLDFSKRDASVPAFAEDVFLAIRFLRLERGAFFDVPVFGLTARIGVGDDETVKTGAGSIRCVRVTVNRGSASSLDLWVGREAPHVLARWKAADGREGTLRALERR